jgi:hypothetical protein
MRYGGLALPSLLLPLLLGCSGAGGGNDAASESGQVAAASQSQRADRVRRIVAEQLRVPADRVIESAGCSTWEPTASTSSSSS